MQLIPTTQGLVLAGTLLASRGADGRLAERERLLAMLTAAHGKALPSRTLGYIRRAGELFAEVPDADLDYAHYQLPRPVRAHAPGDFPAIAKLTMLLALSGFTCASDAKARMTKAEEQLRKGLSPEALHKLLEDDDKDDDEDEEDDDSDSSDADDDSSDDSGFDDKHPRWPAGSPDGTGGEFRAKDDEDNGDNTTLILAGPDDKRFGLPNDFWRWYHRQVKQPGDDDINRPEVVPIYKEWLRLGKPGPDQG